MALSRNTKKWIGGLVSAIAGGMTTVVAVNAMDPADFNLDHLGKLVVIALVVGLFAGLSWIKEHPPGSDGDSSIGPSAWLLPFLLAGSLTAASCAGLVAPPATPGGAPAIPAETAEQINQHAMQVATVGSAVLDLTDQVLDIAHVVVPPSQLRIDINEAARRVAVTVKGIAERAKLVVKADDLSDLAAIVLADVDHLLETLARANNAQLAKVATDIRKAIETVRGFVIGGVR
jgi:hypothetical protein